MLAVVAGLGCGLCSRIQFKLESTHYPENNAGYSISTIATYASEPYKLITS